MSGVSRVCEIAGLCSTSAFMRSDEAPSPKHRTRTWIPLLGPMLQANLVLFGSSMSLQAT